MSTADKDVAKIRKALGHRGMEQQPRAWLNTGILELNEVLGQRELGVPYGRLIEVSGKESQGKSALALMLCAIGQSNGAQILWQDYENSWEPEWVRKRGLDPDKVQLFQNYVGHFGKEKLARLSNASDICKEVEAQVEANHKKGIKFMINVVDSVTSMMSESESEAGLDDGFVKKMALPVFLGGLMRRWCGHAQAYNVLTIFINQLRQNPMQRFGDSWYIPGGNAARFYCHVRVRTKSPKSGTKIKDRGKTAGVKGILENFKNKVGGRRDSSVGYRLLFDGPFEFCPVRDLQKEDEDDE